MKAKYITVLDYYRGEVSIYPIELWDVDNKDIIDILLEWGHISANCKWMIHSNEPVTKQIAIHNYKPNTNTNG
jgi:hypothetical protein